MGSESGRRLRHCLFCLFVRAPGQIGSRRRPPNDSNPVLGISSVSTLSHPFAPPAPSILAVSPLIFLFPVPRVFCYLRQCASSPDRPPSTLHATATSPVSFDLPDSLRGRSPDVSSGIPHQ
jgi:hypothetical protein